MRYAAARIFYDYKIVVQFERCTRGPVDPEVRHHTAYNDGVATIPSELQIKFCP